MRVDGEVQLPFVVRHQYFGLLGCWRSFERPLLDELGDPHGARPRGVVNLPIDLGGCVGAADGHDLRGGRGGVAVRVLRLGLGSSGQNELQREEQRPHAERILRWPGHTDLRRSRPAKAGRYDSVRVTCSTWKGLLASPK